MYGIDKYLTKVIQEKERGSVMLARALQKSLLARFPAFKSEKLTVLSMVIDPRFKSALLEPHEKLLANMWLIEEVNAHLDLETNPENSDNPLQEPEDQQMEPGNLLFQDIDKLISTQSVTSRDKIDMVVNSYLSTPCIPRKDNPCEWWKKNSAEYQLLVPLAMHYLPIPATSVASERLFSAAGNVVTKRRHNLLTDHVEELVFLHENLH